MSNNVNLGDYGWVRHRDPDTDRVRVMYYDDDDGVCSCGDRQCSKYEDEHGEPIGTPSHYFIEQVILYQHPDDLGRMPYELVDIEEIETTGPGVDINTSPGASRREGWVYVIALFPELLPSRIKVGFTTRPITSRMATYRTANPTALVVGLWEGDRVDETAALGRIPGRVGGSEVFNCDPKVAIPIIAKMMNEPRPS